MALQRNSDDTPGAGRRDVRRSSRWFTAVLPLAVVLWTLVASLAGAAPLRSSGPQFGTASGPTSSIDERRDGDRKLLRSEGRVLLGASPRLLDPVGFSPDSKTNIALRAESNFIRLGEADATPVDVDDRILVRQAIHVGGPRAPPTDGGFSRVPA